MRAIEEKKNTTFGFCNASKKLVDISALLRAVKAHCLPAPGVCMQLEDLMQNLRLMTGDTTAGKRFGVDGGGNIFKTKLRPDATSSNVTITLQEALEDQCPICTGTFPVSEVDLPCQLLWRQIMVIVTHRLCRCFERAEKSETFYRNSSPKTQTVPGERGGLVILL
ncbi:uncharacterized protein LOC109075349 isoform X1 [Cyprinus carpio]|uniref:Uncharacterized protein LOC109075349 isoform X1 n=1 Tax=Cyprinus carpio TaxID=7962 RepID=A0A9R0AI91_CYPCA|nr:uncharacterized protein LOC109075349 isoform X1 [Cyprinus carpio]